MGELSIITQSPEPITELNRKWITDGELYSTCSLRLTGESWAPALIIHFDPPHLRRLWSVLWLER